MKKLVCLLLVLALLPCAAAFADLDEWSFYDGGDFTTRYPDYIEPYGVPAEEVGWDMHVFADPDGIGPDGYPNIVMYVLRADEATWSGWKDACAFPDPWGQFITMKRRTVDEPPVMDEPEEVEMVLTMDMSYSLYESMDGQWWLEAFIFDHPTEDDYVVLCRFPADDHWSYDVLHWIIAYMQFPDTEGGSGGTDVPEYDGECAFSLWDYNVYASPFVAVMVDEEAPAIWLYAECPVTDFRLEQLEWSDDLFTVTEAVTIYSDDEFTPEEALSIYTWMPEMAPTLRIRGVNPEGAEEIYYIADSGEDGSLMLIPGDDKGF